MRILHVIRSVDLTQGGPAEWLVRSAPAWRQLEHHREIVSLDLPDDPWVAECPLPTHAMGDGLQRQWVGRLPWLRYGFTRHLVPWLRARARDFDMVVVHGLWNYAAFAARRVLPRCGVPYVVFTHGMLDPWFRQAYPVKHACKQVAWGLVEGPLLRQARAVLFTSEGERAAAVGAFWPSHDRANIVGYGTAAAPEPDPAQVAAWRSALPGLRRPYLLFLGRLHPKKGCDLLLRAFARHRAFSELDLVMAGPDSGGERERLAQLASNLGLAGRVHWPGMLRGTAKWGALHGCEAFVLPSHGENFGIAVAEALACGKPVLISDRVNVAPIIAADGAGLVAPDTVEGTCAMLHAFHELGATDRAAIGGRARACFDRHFDINKIVRGTAEVLARVAVA